MPRYSDRSQNKIKEKINKKKKTIKLQIKLLLNNCMIYQALNVRYNFNDDDDNDDDVSDGDDDDDGDVSGSRFDDSVLSCMYHDCICIAKINL